MGELPTAASSGAPHPDDDAVDSAEGHDGIGTGGLLGRMALYVVLGAPLVFLVWRFLNEALAGEVHGDSAALAAAGLLGLVWLLRLVARQINRWEEGT